MPYPGAYLEHAVHDNGERSLGRCGPGAGEEQVGGQGCAPIGALYKHEACDLVLEVGVEERESRGGVQAPFAVAHDDDLLLGVRVQPLDGLLQGLCIRLHGGLQGQEHRTRGGSLTLEGRSELFAH